MFVVIHRDRAARVPGSPLLLVFHHSSPAVRNGPLAQLDVAVLRIDLVAVRAPVHNPSPSATGNEQHAQTAIFVRKFGLGKKGAAGTYV